MSETCVGCERPIKESDLAHYYHDGPVACLSCAPSFYECEAELRECLSLPGEDAEETARLNRALVHVRAQIAAGRGHEKHVW